MKKKDPRLDETKAKLYRVVCWVFVLFFACCFTFPLYWIITGSFKTGQEINSTAPVWFPGQWVINNYEKLMNERSVPLFELNFGSFTVTGPIIPAAIKWLTNTVMMAAVSMVITCITSAMAGYVLAKKRFYGKTLLFGLIVCAMALPKQVVLIPLVRLMSDMELYAKKGYQLPQHIPEDAWEAFHRLVKMGYDAQLAK